MDVQVEKSGPCEAKISFKVSSAEFETRFKKTLEHAGKQISVKGFRPGKVPAQVVEKMHGPAAQRETLEGLLREALGKAIEDEKLDPAMQPRVDLDELGFERGKDLSHELMLALKPEFELGEYKGLSVGSESTALEDGDVPKALEELKRQNSRPEPVGDEGLAKDGMAVATIEFFNGDESVARRDGLRIGPTTPPAGVDAAAFEQAMVGLKDGDETELEMTFPEDFPNEALRGQKGRCTIEINQAFTLVAPGDDELMQAFGVEDEAALNTKVEEQLAESKVAQENARQETELFDKLIEAHPMPLPASMLDNQIEARRGSAIEQLMSQGATQEEAEAQVDSDTGATREAAEKSLRALFLIEKIGEQESLKVNEQDLIAELRQIALRNRASFEEVRDYYQENNLVQQLSVELLERKVRAFLRENATVS